MIRCDHDKETIQWHWYHGGSLDLPVGWLNKGPIVERCDWLITMRIKGIQVQQIDPINSL